MRVIEHRGAADAGSDVVTAYATDEGGATVVSDHSDVQLAARFRADPECFAVVYDRYIRDIYRYVAARLGAQVADDIAAETFMVAFARRDRFDAARGGLRPWLFGIATNLVAGHRRKEARHYRALARTGDELPADSHEGRVVSIIAAQGVAAELVHALEALTRGERDVVLLVAVSGLTHEEVAEALGISYGTVGSRLSRARAKLRNAVPDIDRSGDL